MSDLFRPHTEYNSELLTNISTPDEFKEFMRRADAADTWDAMEPEEWESACEYVGLNYHDYDDPDTLLDDLTKKLEAM